MFLLKFQAPLERLLRPADEFLREFKSDISERKIFQ